ncbi:ECF-type sigma factor [Terriglobus aquaticus]|uniref:ECF-type sigma factor n=1 Tax=Terriglobus aquaticus TaxID=940139 RepID=A0ABW9KGG0_9BACT|nr:ECF-type sigma factor [Terriglobus aquaticus]
MHAGDQHAASELVPLLYRELHRLAEAAMRRERPGHTLQPTVLVHEAYLQLLQTERIDWQSTAHFLALAANTMRRVLVDHARAAKAQKRPGGHEQVELNSRVQVFEQQIDVLSLNEAMDKLAAFDPRLAQAVEMRFFGGLSFEEIAQAQGISLRTAKRDWVLAKSWLYTELARGSAET